MEPTTAPNAEATGQPVDPNAAFVDESELVEALAIEMYAMRYAPVPRSGGEVGVYRQAMATRRKMWELDDTPRDVWRALAGDLLDKLFGTVEPEGG